jgi:hypothetical protein
MAVNTSLSLTGSKIVQSYYLVKIGGNYSRKGTGNRNDDRATQKEIG